MIYEGGELAFCKQMYEESCFIKDSVEWFSCLFGKKVDYEAMLEFIRGKGNGDVKYSHFTNGNTKRWIIAWKFQGNLRTV